MSENSDPDQKGCSSPILYLNLVSVLPKTLVDHRVPSKLSLIQLMNPRDILLFPVMNIGNI